MIRQCFLAKTGIQFYRKKFIPIGLDPATLFSEVLPRPKQLAPPASYEAELRGSTSPDSHHTPEAACNFISEEHEELLDALSPLNDTLGTWLTPWWFLEAAPFIRYKQDPNDSKKSGTWSLFHWYVFFSLILSLCRSRWV